MRKIAAIILAMTLMVCLVAPATALAQPAEEMSTGDTGDLSILRLPAVLDGGIQLKGNPNNTPPGQNKPKPPDGGNDEQDTNKWAVVVGISDYEGTDADLWNPDNDATEMARALMTKYGFPDANVRVLLNEQATAEAILSAIDWLSANEDEESTVVFFFNGHGFRVPDADGWDDDDETDGYDEGIITYDFYGLPDGQSTQHATLGNEFAQFDTQKFALIFGSCFSGGMFDDDCDLQAEGRVICSACAADQYGWDYSLLQNTLFGYYFVDQGILKKRADTNRDGVSMEEALAYVYPRVVAQQPDSEPQISDGYAGELIL